MIVTTPNVVGFNPLEVVLPGQQLHQLRTISARIASPGSRERS